MKKSIKAQLEEHRAVMRMRTKLQNILKYIADCHVKVGGSYMLKYWCEDFNDREVSDYDFIVYANTREAHKIQDFMSILATQLQGISSSYYDFKSFYFGKLNGLKVNVIIKPVDGEFSKLCTFESLEDIIAIKKQWIEGALKEGKSPRDKDVSDVSTYEAWKTKQEDLPF